MAALLLLLAVVGGILVGDLVLENPAAGAVENASLREELAHRDRPLPGPAEAARPDELGSAWTASVAEDQARVLPLPVDRHPEPVSEQARGAARLRSDLDR
jgi:hypothetical protein